MRAVVELERRNAAVQVALQELRRARRAGIDVEIGPVVAEAELREQQADLVAVAGIQVVEEVHGCSRGEPADLSLRRCLGRTRSRRLGAQAKLFLAMARRLPPLNALRAFEASARLGSFVAAAAELHVSAAAVSQQVRRLERYLDTTLFQRLARGLVLTEEGRDYLPELSAGFDLLGESTTRLRTQRAGGVLTLTTLAAFANGWLLPRLHRFHERASRVEVVLRTSRTLADFKRDDIDLAIRFAPGPGRGLHGELLCGGGALSRREPEPVRRRPHAGHARSARGLPAAARHRRASRAAVDELARMVRARGSRPRRRRRAARSSPTRSC